MSDNGLQSAASDPQPKRGLLISFDGTDSSGKETQARELTTRLRSAGHRVNHFETPDYSTTTGIKIKALFQETNGSWDDLPWSEQMKLIAANRAEHKKEVINAIEQGTIVIYDRYVPSSQAHMTVSALSAAEVNTKRQGIIEEVNRYEYEINQMPRENLSIFLDVPPKIAAQLLANRQYKHQDKAEATDEISLQERIYNEYKWLTANDPEQFACIECLVGDQLLPPSDIAEKVWQAITAKFPHLIKAL